MKFRNLAFIITCTLITSCACKPEIKIVKEYEQVVIKSPSELLEPLVLPTPPAKNDYALATCSGKETMLVDYSVSLLTNLYKCNTRINSVRDFQDKATKIQKGNDE